MKHADCDAGREWGRKAVMTIMRRRSVLRASLGAVATGTLVLPYLANAAATTATVWWMQGFAQEEDVVFRKIASRACAKYTGSVSNLRPTAPIPTARSTLF